jgi:succinate dehydrogenase (ubiquinone) membrane anchor subunit
MERLLSVALIGIIPASLMLESQILDYVLAASLIVHSAWGLKVIATDYIHGPTMPKLAINLIYVSSILAFIGLCYFNYSDIGLSKAIKKIWQL